MKTIIQAQAVKAYHSGGQKKGVAVEIDLSESQAYEALRQILNFVSDDTWMQWQRQINAEIYGQPQVVTT